MAGALGHRQVSTFEGYIMETIWQYRSHHGLGWTEWQDLTEGEQWFSTVVEFRIKPENPEDCSVPDCDAVAEVDGLCAWHDQYVEECDPWPEDDPSDYYHGQLYR